MTTEHQRIALEDRIKKEKAKVQAILDKMTNMDQEFTEVDMREINVLKQSVKACQSSLAKLQEGQSAELIPIPRPPVLPLSIVEPRPASTRRSSRSTDASYHSR